ENTLVSLYNSFKNLIDLSKKNTYSWNIYSKDREYIDFHCFPLKIYEEYESEKFDSISLLVDEYYYYKDKYQRMQQRIHHLKKIVDKNISKNQTKLLKLKKEFEESKDRDKYKVYGDLIIAYMSRIQDFEDSVTVNNYYDDNKEIEIPLDNRLSLSQNAQKYYKKYEKLKTAQVKINNQIKLTKQKLDYFYNLQYMVNNCDDFEAVNEIKEELASSGYLKNKKSKNKKSYKSKPYKILSKDGFEIYIGKNNKQNDYNKPVLINSFVYEPDIVLVMDNAIIDKGVNITEGINKNSILVLNTEKDKVLERYSKFGFKELYYVDGTKVAIKNIGRGIPNGSMLGAIAGTNLLKIESLEKAIIETFGEKAGEKNAKAAREAYETIKKI
ncbi:MAG: NFACT family protein, partial [Tissierellales bacterium]|nr:NFACT family protein [Tissierellales bacterium]